MDLNHCPRCGTEPGFVQEYWTGADRNFLCWCPRCELMCTVVLSPQLVGTEPEH